MDEMNEKKENAASDLFEKAGSTVSDIFEKAGDNTGSYEEEDIRQNKTMAGLAYILFFLPLIACKDSKFGRFHANQGLLLLILSIAGSIVISMVSTILATITWRMFGFISILYSVYGLLIFAQAIYGLVNGFNGKAKELPIIGKFRIIK